MDRSRTALGLLLLVLVSCAHSDSYRIESAVNVYLDRLREYDVACHRATVVAGCREVYGSLLEVKSELRYCADALARGGSMAPQMARLDVAMRRLDAARVNP